MADREMMQDLVKQHLLRPRARMKRQADKGLLERTFAVGDMVYLKLQTYILSSLVRRSTNKLSFQFFDPFQILEKIGSIAYKLCVGLLR